MWGNPGNWHSLCLRSIRSPGSGHLQCLFLEVPDLVTPTAWCSKKLPQIDWLQEEPLVLKSHLTGVAPLTTCDTWESFIRQAHHKILWKKLIPHAIDWSVTETIQIQGQGTCDDKWPNTSFKRQLGTIDCPIVWHQDMLAWHLPSKSAGHIMSSLTPVNCWHLLLIHPLHCHVPEDTLCSPCYVKRSQ